MSRIARLTRDATLNNWLHYSWYLEWAKFTNWCLIKCLINSLSSCVYTGERGYMVRKEKECVFEVVFCKSLEDNQAQGWSQAVGREATTTFPLQDRNWSSPWPSLEGWHTIAIFFISNNMCHHKQDVLKWQKVNREKTKQCLIKAQRQATTSLFCPFTGIWALGNIKNWDSAILRGILLPMLD